MLPPTTESQRPECWRKKMDCWLLMALGAMQETAMKQLSNVLLHHENEPERTERISALSRSIVPCWFDYEVEKNLMISLLNCCLSKIIGVHNSTIWGPVWYLKQIRRILYSLAKQNIICCTHTQIQWGSTAFLWIWATLLAASIIYYDVQAQ